MHRFRLRLKAPGGADATLDARHSQGLLDSEVKRSILVGHEELAEDGVLVVCGRRHGGGGAGRGRGPRGQRRGRQALVTVRLRV